VVCRRDQNRVEKPFFVTIGEPLAMQQENGVGERRALHQLSDVITANPYCRIVCLDDCGAPRFLQVPIITARTIFR
jgi:hypothetical protein